VLFRVRMDAADEMYRIEAGYEAEPGLTPLLSIELTPVHDPGRCRQRRLAAALASAEELARQLSARLAQGKLTLERHAAAMRALDERIARLRAGGPPHALTTLRRP
jgi:uncharacterized coiled-coil protein SlyX